LQGIQALLKVIKDLAKRRKNKGTTSEGFTEETIGDEILLNGPDGKAPLPSDGSFRGRARSASSGGKKAQTQSDWVNEYKEGVDITQAVDRNQMRRKVAGGVAIARAQGVAPGDGVNIATAQNPLWAGTTDPSAAGATASRPVSGSIAARAANASVSGRGPSSSVASRPPTASVSGTSAVSSTATATDSLSTTTAGQPTLGGVAISFI